MTTAIEIAEELARLPANSWVALTPDESAVVFAAPTQDEAIAGAAKHGVTDPVLLKTPDDWGFLIP
jgi:hypothetical protein